MQTINIHTKDLSIHLESKKYRIYVLGGLGIKMGEFSLSIEKRRTKEIIHSKRTKWPVQSYLDVKRSKRILTLNHPVKGDYNLIIKKPKTLQIKESNLLTSSLFRDPIDNDKIEIYFQ